MSDLDTEITGSPTAIESVASWLRDTLKPALTAAADTLTTARTRQGESWDATAGEAFSETMRQGVQTVDDFASAVGTNADDLDDFAHSLRRCQDDMTAARQAATDGGLVVSGFVIQHPGTGPSYPYLPPDATDAQYTRWYNDTVAWEAHQAKLTTYDIAAAEVDRVDRAYSTACEALNGDITPGAHASWIVTVADLTNAGFVAAAGVGVAMERFRMNQRAAELFAQGQAQLDDIAANSGLLDRRYRRISWLPFFLDRNRIEADRLAAQGLIDQAEEIRMQAAALEPGRVPRILRAGGRILGPLGIGLGVYNDWQEGETVVQIAASQGGAAALGAGAGALAGWGAAVGTGALMGAAFGSVVPGVGTAIGAVVGVGVGAVVGIFADGAIDSFFENGPDVGKAFEEGLEAIGDTGEAIGDFFGGAAETVGGWFS